MAEPNKGIDDEDLVDGRDYELVARPRNWPPLARRVGGVYVVELIDIDAFQATPPHRKLLLLVFLLALKDRATAIHFEPWRFEEVEGGGSGMRMFYEVDGQLDELVPPPACLAARIFRDLKLLSGLNSPRRRAADLLRRLAGLIDGQRSPPRRGRFRMNHSSGHAYVEVMVHDSDLGERFFLTLSPTPEVGSKAATEAMRRLFGILILGERRRK